MAASSYLLCRKAFAAQEAPVIPNWRPFPNNWCIPYEKLFNCPNPHTIQFLQMFSHILQHLRRMSIPAYHLTYNLQRRLCAVRLCRIAASIVPAKSKTPLQATGYQTCSAAEQRGIWPSRQSPNVCKQPLGSLLAGINILCRPVRIIGHKPFCQKVPSLQIRLSSMKKRARAKCYFLFHFNLLLSSY